MKDIHILNPEQITEPITEPQLRGFQFTKAPQAALTAPALVAGLPTTPNTGDADTDTLISNMRTRIANLEDRLIKLGLIQKT